MEPPVIRTQIQLSEAQARSLKLRAAASGRSMADLIREGVDQLLERHGEADPDVARRRARAAFGRFRSGVRDLARRHDAYLAKGQR
jgi:hypothetical protein